MFQHIFNIRSASSAYVRDNVYMYDYASRRHMERKPWRNWGKIHQRGWLLILKEKLDKSNTNLLGFSSRRRDKFRGGDRTKEIFCWKFN